MRSTAMTIAFGAMLAACGQSGAAPANTDAAPVPEQSAEATQPVSAAEEEAAMRNVQTELAYPAAFRGEWDWNVDGCEKVESSTRFTITANKIKGYESESTLLRIREEAPDHINTTVHLESSAGEDTYEQIMILSPVNGVSMRVEADGESSRAYRCDGVKPDQSR